MNIIQRFIGPLTLGLIDLVLSAWLLRHFEDLSHPTLMLIGLRIVVTVALFFWIKPHFKDHPVQNSVIIFFLSTLYFIYSFFGLVAFLLMLERLDSRQKQTSKLYHIDQEEGEIEDAEDGGNPPKTVSIIELTKVAPLVDGLTDDNKNSRIAAIQAMEALIDNATIREALIAAKRDPHKEVQYFINDALKKVSEETLGKIKEQRDILNEEEPTYASFKKMADLYAHIANANIDHPVLVRFYHQESAKYYGYLLEHYPEYKQAVLEKLIPALYQSKATEKCLALCETLRDDPVLSSVARLYQCRCLFVLRKIEAVKDMAATIHLDGILSQDNLFHHAPLSHG